jgi:hypothetical protein
VHFSAAPLLALASGMTGIQGTHGAAPDAGADSHREIVSVADIRERRVPLEWHEAVAIVAGLCSALVESQATTMPAAGEIVLAQDGTIVVRYPSRNTDWVGLPRLLHKLLSVAPQQTPLRLFVLNAISSEGDKSPAAFGAALAYYERPGRDVLIRAVRERFFVTPIPPPGSEPDDVEEPEIESPPKTLPTPAPRRKRLRAAALVMSASVVAVTLVAGRTPGTGTPTDHTNALADIVAHVAATGREVARGVGTAMTAAVASRNDETPTPTPAPAEAPRARAPRPHVASSAPAVTSTAAPMGVTVLEPVSAPVAREPEAEAVAPIEEPAPAADHAPGEIVPPRLLEPVRLPGWAAPAAGTMTEVIELEISPSGAVDRVRLISPAMRMTDMMILSAAKTWIFQPASQDGQPVPYRMTLKWVSPNP